MATLADTLTDLVRQAADAAGHADSPIPLEPCVATNNPDHGDYQSNFAFRLGKSMRTNPRQVAQAIADAMPEHPAVAAVEVAGPGFLNFRLDDEWLASDVHARLDTPHLGAPQPGEGRTVVIDYSSPNVAKRMHIGHLRSTIIGDAIRRLYAFLGWNVVADNHIGDWGTQFGKLIVAWNGWRDDAAYEDDPIGELQRIYQEFGSRAEADPTLIDQARAETAKLQAGDDENIALWERFVEASMDEFDALYERLGVEFDVTHGESFYRDGLQDLIDDLLERGIASINENAAIIPFEPGEGKGLGKSPLLIRKSDGAALYGTTDLATILHRQETWDPERVVYVTDLRQQLHFRQVFAAARKMGVEGMDLRHVWFGILRVPEGGILSTRSTKPGESLNLIDVLDTAKARARAVVDEASRGLSEDEKDAISEAVGVGAVKYFDLSQNPQSDITFDWDRSLALDGNSAPYLMYAHARCCSIERKAYDAGVTPGPLVLEDAHVRGLALAVCQLPEAILVAAETSRPNLLCDHLYGLARETNRIYNSHRVLGEGIEPELAASRLTLFTAIATALRLGLDLLGVQAPEQM